MADVYGSWRVRLPQDLERVLRRERERERERERKRKYVVRITPHFFQGRTTVRRCERCQKGVLDERDVKRTREIRVCLLGYRSQRWLHHRTLSRYSHPPPPLPPPPPPPPLSPILPTTTATTGYRYRRCRRRRCRRRRRRRRLALAIDFSAQPPRPEHTDRPRLLDSSNIVARYFNPFWFSPCPLFFFPLLFLSPFREASLFFFFFFLIGKNEQISR